MTAASSLQPLPFAERDESVRLLPQLRAISHFALAAAVGSCHGDEEAAAAVVLTALIECVVRVVGKMDPPGSHRGYVAPVARHRILGCMRLHWMLRGAHPGPWAGREKRWKNSGP